MFFIPSLGIFNIRGGGRPKKSVASPIARADLLQDFIPRNTHWPRPFEIVKPLVKFLALRVRQRNSLRLFRKAVPEFLD